MSRGGPDKNDKVVALPFGEDIDAEAARWVARLTDEDRDPDTVKRFEAWAAKSEEHRSAYEGMRALSEELSLLRDLNDIADLSAEFVEPPRTFLARRGALAALAASVVIAATGAGYVLNQQAPVVETQRFATAVGGQDTITLPDGSTAHLNTNTALSVAFTSKRRQITLVEGEAYFAVEKDAERPFVVAAADHAVEAVGTAFVVKVTGDRSLDVAVEEGRVALSSQQDTTTSPSTVTDAAQRHFLNAGQAATINDQTEEFRDMSDAELNRKLSWRRGVLSYSGEPLSEVVADVSRYTDITIEIADPSLNDLPIGGFIPVGEVEQFFESLELVFGVHVEHVSDTHVRLRSSS